MNERPAEPDAERVNFVIASGLPLSELAAEFPSRREAYHYYARFTAERYGRPEDGRCALCGAADPTEPYLYTWQACGHTWPKELWGVVTTMLALNSNDVLPPSQRVVFDSRHAICMRCARSVRWTRGVVRAVGILVFVLMIPLLLGFFAGLTFGVMAACISGYYERWEVAGYLFTCGVLAGFAFAGCACGFLYLRHLSIPTALRGIGRFPFAIKRILRGSGFGASEVGIIRK